MARPYCNVCHRPQVSCICHLITVVDNDIDVIVLQHPSEVKQAKGTVTLLEHSLVNCQVFVGEDFSTHAPLNQLLLKHHQQLALLYPSEEAETIEALSDNKRSNASMDIRCLILLDGTWKKAYRLYMMNGFLKRLPHLSLPESIQGQYQIRKTRKEGALSTLEACCYALAMMEGENNKYDKLLLNFNQFNQMQMAFNPTTKN